MSGLQECDICANYYLNTDLNWRTSYRGDFAWSKLTFLLPGTTVCNVCIRNSLHYEQCLYCRKDLERKYTLGVEPSVACSEHEYLQFLPVKEVLHYMRINFNVIRDRTKYRFPEDKSKDRLASINKTLGTIELALKHLVAEIDKRDMIKTFTEITEKKDSLSLG